MSHPINYLEHSIETISSIDMHDLSELRLGQRIGTGSQFTMRHLGNITISDKAVSTGIKVGRGRNASRIRLRSELAAATLLTDFAPEVRPRLPAFMGLIAVEGNDEAIGLLTEDASRNNPSWVHSRAISEASRARLAAGFMQFGTFETIFNNEVLNSSMAFSADTEERWLDLTPSPLKSSLPEPLNGLRSGYLDAASHSFASLTCTVPADSPLAQSLAPYVDF